MNDKVSQLPSRHKYVYPSYYELTMLVPSTISKSFLINKLLSGFSITNDLKNFFFTPDTVRLFDWTEREYDAIRNFDREQKRMILFLIIYEKMELQPKFWDRLRSYRTELSEGKKAA